MSQLVIAFRGTDGSNSLIGLKNVLADASFVSNTPSNDFSICVSYAAALVKEVHRLYGDANITLTSHSSGGAIAQLVGKKSGLPAITFNAPGPDTLYKKLTTQLFDATGIGTGGAIMNYRLYDEQVSFVGTQVGSTITLPAPAYLILSYNPFLPTISVLADLFKIYYLHGIATMIDQINTHAQPIIPIGEPYV